MRDFPTGAPRRAHREAARRFAENTAPVIHQIRASGVASLRGIAAVLARAGRAAAE